MLLLFSHIHDTLLHYSHDENVDRKRKEYADSTTMGDEAPCFQPCHRFMRTILNVALALFQAANGYRPWCPFLSLCAFT